MMEQMTDILSRFDLPGKVISCLPYGNGHINDTFRILCEREKAESSSFILQRINRNVFHHPDQVMENITGIISWLTGKYKEAGRDVTREVLCLVPEESGRGYTIDDSGEYWRVYRFIENAVCYEQAESEESFRQSALAFGSFQRLLSDYPARTLHETIPDFHNTPVRFEQFTSAVERDPVGRYSSCRWEADFLLGMEKLAHRLYDAHKVGKLPLRVTHNDTKLNNVMMDVKTGKALCILDLDTVMPGFSVTDFGDAIRFGANTAREDEPDLKRVGFDRHLYEVYREGYLEGCEGSLTREEEALLPDGAEVITCEQALRFLTDYLEGDVYYKTAYPEHNLIRARTQIRLLDQMLAIL